MKLLTLFFVSIFLSSIAFADSEEPSQIDPSEIPEEERGTPIPKEYHLSVSAKYSLFETWLPSKKGLSASWAFYPDSIYTFEWLNASLSIDILIPGLGEISEDRLTLMKKSLNGRSSFYWIYGLNYYKFEAFLGKKFFTAGIDVPKTSIDLVTMESIGFTWGLGNRFKYERWIFDIDWLTLHIPLHQMDGNSDYLKYSNDEGNKEEVKKLIDTVSSIPTFGLLKLGAGYSF